MLHAYSLVAAIEQSGQRLLQLQNPHGGHGKEWNGDWSDDSTLWRQYPELARACGAVNRRDGTFWMCWEDFRSHFHVVTITNQDIRAMAAPEGHPPVQPAPGGRSLLDRLLGVPYAVVRLFRNFDRLVVAACVAVMNVVALALSFIVGPMLAKLTTRLAGILLVLMAVTTARIVLWTLLAGVARAMYLVYAGDIRSLDDAREDSGRVWVLLQAVKPFVEAELDIDLNTQLRAVRSIAAKFLSDRWLLVPLCLGFRFVHAAGHTFVALSVAAMNAVAFLLSFVLGSTLARLATRLAGWPLILAFRIAVYTLLIGVARAMWHVGVGDARSVEDAWPLLEPLVTPLGAWHSAGAVMQDVKPVLEAQFDVNLDGLSGDLRPAWSYVNFYVEQALQRVPALEMSSSSDVWPLLEPLGERICGPKPSYSDSMLGRVGLAPSAPPHAYLCMLWTS